MAYDQKFGAEGLTFDDVVLMVQVKAQCGRHDPMSWTTEAALIMCQRLRTHLVTYMSSSSARVLRCKLPTDLFLIEIRLGPLMGAISLLFEIGPVPMTWHRWFPFRH